MEQDTCCVDPIAPSLPSALKVEKWISILPLIWRKLVLKDVEGIEEAFFALLELVWLC